MEVARQHRRDVVLECGRSGDEGVREARMMERGAEAEVRALLARNVSADLPAMRALGVDETII